MAATASSKRALRIVLVGLAIPLLMGAGDQAARFNDLGHRMMCVCSCNQILLECNHVGCTYSDRMRAELVAAVDRGDNDDLTLQSFVQKYGPPVLAAPTKSGFDRVAWIAPYLVLLLGLATVVLIVGVWRGRGGNDGDGGGQSGGSSGGPRGGPELDRFRAQARKETET